MPSLVTTGSVVHKLSMYFCYFTFNYPWKRSDPSFEQTLTPFIQECFLPTLVEIFSMVLEKEMKMGKVYYPTNNEQILIRKAHLVGSERSRMYWIYMLLNKSFLLWWFIFHITCTANVLILETQNISVSSTIEHLQYYQS